MSQSKELPISGENPFFGGDIAERDPDIARVLGSELTRQKDQIELIASENIVSKAVMQCKARC